MLRTSRSSSVLPPSMLHLTKQSRFLTMTQRLTRVLPPCAKEIAT